MNNLGKLLREIVRKKKPCYFFSPHLDDAVLSCGSLLSYLSGKTPVTVVTVFTKASEKPYTFSAKRFLKKCNENDAELLFKKRKSEDTLAMNTLRISSIHCGMVDGTWRKKSSLSKVRKKVGKIFPELLYRYPTFFHVSSGKLSGDDLVFSKELRASLKKYIPKNAVIFAPLGIGNHIDHVLVRKVFSGFPNIIYWSDFPYNVTKKPDEAFVRNYRLKMFSFKSDKSKLDLIKCYASQIPSLFPNGKIAEKEEAYYIPASK